MNAIWLILALGAGVFSLRIAGLLLPNRSVPVAWEQALRFVPVALLTSLVVLNLTGTSDESPVRIFAAVGAVIVARLTGQMWACILSGMTLYWILGLF